MDPTEVPLHTLSDDELKVLFDSPTVGARQRRRAIGEEFYRRLCAMRQEHTTLAIEHSTLRRSVGQ